MVATTSPEFKRNARELPGSAGLQKALTLTPDLYVLLIEDDPAAKHQAVV